MPVQLYDTLPVRYSGNPIIPLVPGWYEVNIADPVVMVNPLDATQLLMYMTGQALPRGSGGLSIGLFRAARSNPFAWTEYGQVLTGSGSGWDAAYVRVGS